MYGQCVQVLSSNKDSHRHCVWWNPSNIILFGLIVGAAAILSSQCWKINLSHETIMPEMSLLARRIQDLESENLALKVEVNRLVELHHAGHDDARLHEKFAEKRSVKEKKVWTGADDNPTLIPKEPVKEDYCNDEYLNSDDLFASYNMKKCENIDDSRKQKKQKVKSKVDSDDDEILASDNSSRSFESRRKKNFTNNDNASIKREKFAESKSKNAKTEPAPETDENIRNEKFVQIQEERQKLYDDAKQKYLERQKKMEMKQAKDSKKHPEDVLKESKNSRRPAKDIDSEWYDKMMKQREEMRSKGDYSGGKQQNKENWYLERANEREKVRGKHEKQTKTKQYR